MPPVGGILLHKVVAPVGGLTLFKKAEKAIKRYKDYDPPPLHRVCLAKGLEVAMLVEDDVGGQKVFPGYRSPH